MERIRAAVQSTDPLTQEGLASSLRSRSEVVVQPQQCVETDVLVVAADRFSVDVTSSLRRSVAEFGTPVVLITNEMTEVELLTAVECRVVAVVPRSRAVGKWLAHSVVAAAKGGGVLPPNLLGELLKHVERLQREVLAPQGLTAAGLTPREIDVLRLMADGCDTAEIADKLCYSERMIKSVVHGLTSRLNLRNRPHAVAYALRAGVI